MGLVTEGMVSGAEGQKKRSRLEVYHTPAELQNTIDSAVTKMIVAGNCPFRLVEHQAFKDLIHILRPGAKVPTRKQVAGPLLDDLHSRILAQLKADFNGKMASLSIDGWSTVTREPVIGATITVENQTVLFATVDTSGVSLPISRVSLGLGANTMQGKRTPQSTW
jgi:hypothetical protein